MAGAFQNDAFQGDAFEVERSFTADAIISLEPPEERLPHVLTPNITATGVFRPAKRIAPQRKPSSFVVNTQARVAQLVTEVLAQATDANARVAQLVVEVLQQVPLPFRNLDKNITATARWRPAQRIAPQRIPTRQFFEGAALVEGSFTADAVLLREQVAVFAADGVLLKQATSTLTADASLATLFTGSFAADAIVLRAASLSFTTDAIVRREQAGSLSADAVVRREQSGSLTADAITFQTASGSLTGDAYILIPGAFTGDFTADAVTRVARSGSLPADAVIRSTTSASLTANAVLFRSTTASATANAVIFKAVSGSSTADAITRTTTSQTFTANAIPRLLLSGSLTADAVLKRTRIYGAGGTGGGTNWATPANGASATGSSTWSSEVASNAIDSDDATGWSSNLNALNGEWLRVDLGQPRTVYAARVYDSQYEHAFTLQYSTDGTNWTNGPAIYGAASDVRVNLANAVTARYWRILFFEGSNGCWIKSFELLSAGYVESSPLNFALLTRGIYIQSTSGIYAGNYARHAFDANSGTAWVPNINDLSAGTTWLRVLLAIERTITSIRVHKESYTNGYNVEYWNGSSWTIAFSRSGASPDDYTHVLSSPVTAQDWRIRMTSGSSGVDIRAFELIGSSGEGPGISVDAQLIKTTSATFTADAWIVIRTTASLSVDAYLKRLVSGSFTVDARVFTGYQEFSFSADAVVYIPPPPSNANLPARGIWRPKKRIPPQGRMKAAGAKNGPFRFNRTNNHDGISYVTNDIARAYLNDYAVTYLWPWFRGATRVRYLNDRFVITGWNSNLLWTKASDPRDGWVDILNQGIIGERILMDVAYGDGLWAVVGEDDFLEVSATDGATWTAYAVPFSFSSINSIHYHDGIWVMGTGTGEMAWATDPRGSWTLITSGFAGVSIQEIRHSHGPAVWLGQYYPDGIWVAVGDNGYIASTHDPSLTWVTTSIQSVVGVLVDLWCVAYANGLWAVGTGDGKIATASDPALYTNWTQRTSGTPTSFSAIAFDRGIWTAVGGTGSSSIKTSTNGITWTLRTSPYPVNQAGTGGAEAANGFTVVAAQGTTLPTGSTSLFLYYAFMPFTADAVVKASRAGSFAADADIEFYARHNIDVTADAIVRREATGSFTADAWVKRNQTGSYTADAWIVQRPSGSYTADAVIRRTMLSAFATVFPHSFLRLDAQLDADLVIGTRTTTGFNADAVLSRTSTPTFTADAVVTKLIFEDVFSRTTTQYLEGAWQWAPWDSYYPKTYVPTYVDGSTVVFPESDSYVGMPLPLAGTIFFDFYVPATWALFQPVYGFVFDAVPAEWSGFYVFAHSDSTWRMSQFGTDGTTSFTPDPSSWYRARCAWDGTTARIAVWKVGDPPNQAWDRISPQAFDIAGSPTPPFLDLYQNPPGGDGKVDNIQVWTWDSTWKGYGNFQADAVICKNVNAAFTADADIVVGTRAFGSYSADAIVLRTFTFLAGDNPAVTGTLTSTDTGGVGKLGNTFYIGTVSGGSSLPYVYGSAGATGTSRFPSFTKPVGTAAGDWIYLFINVDNAGTITPPGGFSQMDSSLVGDNRFASYRKTAGGSEPFNYVFTLGASTSWSGGIVVIRNPGTTSATIIGAQDTGTSHTIDAPGYNTTRPGVFIRVYYSAAFDNGGWSAASGTEQFDAGTTFTSVAAYTENSGGTGIDVDSVIIRPVFDSYFKADAWLTGHRSFLAEADISAGTRTFSSFTADAVLVAAGTQQWLTADAVIFDPGEPTQNDPTDWGDDIVIRYDGTDITSVVMLRDAEFVGQVNGAVGSCHFRVKDPTHVMSFVSGKELTLDIAGNRLWGGYVMRAKKNFYFPAENTIEDDGPDGVVRGWDIEGVDYNVLFQKRIVFSASRPTRKIAFSYPADTYDDTIIKDIFDHYLDLTGLGISRAGVTRVDKAILDVPGAGHRGTVASAGYTWGQAMSNIARATGAVYYISPTKVFTYVDVDTADSVWHLTDQPTGQWDIGYREMEILYNGTAMVNDMLVWGAALGSDKIKFARSTDTSSVNEHLRWQKGLFSQSLYRQSNVQRVANSYVYGSPQNKRGGKDDQISFIGTVFEPVFIAGQKVRCTSAIYDYEDILPIRRMVVTFPTKPTAPNKVSPMIQLVNSHEIDTPWSFFEWILPKFPRVNPPREPDIIQPKPKPSCVDEPIDVVFLADTTGSASNLVNPFKALVEDAVNLYSEIRTDIRFGLAEYHDREGSEDANDWYIVAPMGTGSELIAALPDFGLAVNGALSGGDTPENWLRTLYELFIDVAPSDPTPGLWNPFVPSAAPMGWSTPTGRKKLLIWMGDATAHISFWLDTLRDRDDVFAVRPDDLVIFMGDSLGRANSDNGSPLYNVPGGTVAILASPNGGAYYYDGANNLSLLLNAAADWLNGGVAQFDTFSRTISGSWGQNDYGTLWTRSGNTGGDSSISVNGSEGRIVLRSDGNVGDTLMSTDYPSGDIFNFESQFIFETMPVGDQEELHLRFGTTNNINGTWYGSSLLFGGMVAVVVWWQQINANLGALRIGVTTDPGDADTAATVQWSNAITTVFPVNEYWRLRWSYSDVSVAAKMWRPLAEEEPIDWQVSAPLVASMAGLVTFLVGWNERLNDVPPIGVAHAVRIDYLSFGIEAACSGTPDPWSGYLCESPDTTDRRHFQLDNAFIGGSTQVFVEGLRQTNPSDYTESPSTGEIIFASQLTIPEADSVYVCYTANGAPS